MHSTKNYFNKNTVIVDTISCTYQQQPQNLNDVFNIAYGIDKNFQFGCAISIASILLHNPNIDFHFHIFTDVLDDDFKSKIDLLAKQYASAITIYLVDCEELKKLPSNKNWSYAAYFRFLLADVLYSEINKVLYLDADIICKNSMQEICVLDISLYVAAVVPEGEQPWWNQRAKDLNTEKIQLGYFNSGFLLMNVNKWHDFQITKKAMEMFNDENIKKIISFPDQDILNMVLAGHLCFIEHKYNTQFNLNYELKVSKGSVCDTPINEHTVFIHYIGITKPWHEWAYDYPSAVFFMNAKKHSPWINDDLLLPTNMKHLRYQARHKIHQEKFLIGLFYSMKYRIKKLFK